MLRPPISIISADEASPQPSRSRDSSIGGICRSSSYACLADLNASPTSCRSGKGEAPHLVIKLVRPPTSRPPSARAAVPRAPRLIPLHAEDDLVAMEPLTLDSPALSDATPPSFLAADPLSSTRPPRLARKLAPTLIAPEMETLTLPAALSATCTTSYSGPTSQLSLYREMHTAAFSAMRGAADARRRGTRLPRDISVGGHRRDDA